MCFWYFQTSVGVDRCIDTSSCLRNVDLPACPPPPTCLCTRWVWSWLETDPMPPPHPLPRDLVVSPPRPMFPPGRPPPTLPSWPPLPMWCSTTLRQPPRGPGPNISAIRHAPCHCRRSAAPDSHRPMCDIAPALRAVAVAQLLPLRPVCHSRPSPTWSPHQLTSWCPPPVWTLLVSSPRIYRRVFCPTLTRWAPWRPVGRTLPSWGRALALSLLRTIQFCPRMPSRS